MFRASFRSILFLLFSFISVSSIFSQAASDSTLLDSNHVTTNIIRPNSDTMGVILGRKEEVKNDSAAIIISKKAQMQGDSSIHAVSAGTKTAAKNGTHPARKFYWNSAKAMSDSTLSGDKKLRRHSPLYAALFSAVLPGLGQAYNRKYWKIPIVYAGLGGLGYGLYALSTSYNGYRAAYRLQVDEDPLTHGSYKGVDDVATLKAYRDSNKNNLDIVAIVTAVWYTLNIVDAAVDAHLFEWNMKDDIHLSWQPSVLSPQSNYSQTSLGVKLNLNF